MVLAPLLRPSNIPSDKPREWFLTAKHIPKDAIKDKIDE